MHECTNEEIDKCEECKPRQVRTPDAWQELQAQVTGHRKERRTRPARLVKHGPGCLEIWMTVFFDSLVES